MLASEDHWRRWILKTQPKWVYFPPSISRCPTDWSPLHVPPPQPADYGLIPLQTVVRKELGYPVSKFKKKFWKGLGMQLRVKTLDSLSVLEEKQNQKQNNKKNPDFELSFILLSWQMQLKQLPKRARQENGSTYQDTHYVFLNEDYKWNSPEQSKMQWKSR